MTYNAQFNFCFRPKPFPFSYRLAHHQIHLPALHPAPPPINLLELVTPEVLSAASRRFVCGTNNLISAKPSETDLSKNRQLPGGKADLPTSGGAFWPLHLATRKRRFGVARGFRGADNEAEFCFGGNCFFRIFFGRLPAPFPPNLCRSGFAEVAL